MRASSSLCSSASSHPSSHTASGRYCCNARPHSVARLVGWEGFNTASGRYCCNLERRLSYFLCCYAVSIPQAVGTVATRIIRPTIGTNCVCFNTASGRYCCNCLSLLGHCDILVVSIPQAVGTVATLISALPLNPFSAFQYRKR